MFQSWPYQQETYFLASARLAFGKTSNLRVSQLDTLHELVLAGLIYQRMRKTATRWKASCPQCGSAKAMAGISFHLHPSNANRPGLVYMNWPGGHAFASLCP